MTSPTFVQNDGCLTVVHRYLPVGSIESHFRTFVHEVYWKESGVGMEKKKVVECVRVRNTSQSTLRTTAIPIHSYFHPR